MQGETRTTTKSAENSHVLKRSYIHQHSFKNQRYCKCQSEREGRNVSEQEFTVLRFERLKVNNALYLEKERQLNSVSHHSEKNA